MYLDLQNKVETQTDVTSLFQLNLLPNTFPIIFQLALHTHTFKNTQSQQHLADQKAFICLFFGLIPGIAQEKGMVFCMKIEF